MRECNPPRSHFLSARLHSLSLPSCVCIHGGRDLFRHLPIGIFLRLPRSVDGFAFHFPFHHPRRRLLVVLGLGKQNFFSVPSSRDRPSLFPSFQDLRLSSLFCALDDPDPSAVLALVAAAPAALLGRPNAEGEALVHVAAGRGRADVVRALADRAASAGGRGVDLLAAADGAGDGALVWAARQGHTEVMRLLLDLGCDVNRANEVGDVGWAETNLS